ncbi:MAG: PilZ domain-containing protein [Desulfobacterales bacterium]|nr:PilZ domain-containing protein [Desulfobacterales bacterium]
MTRFEKRKMERFSLKVPARFIWTDTGSKQESLELMTSNICSGGAFFKTEKPLSVGTDVKLEIILPLVKSKNVNSKGSSINVAGSVIRSDQQGMAVCFDKKYHIHPMHS